MVMPPCGTFDYDAIVPDEIRSTSVPWCASLREPISPIGDELADSRLVGYSPRITLEDAGQTPNPGSATGVLRPKVMRTRLELAATDRQHAQVASATFYVATSLISLLQPRDILHLSRTSCAGIGLSIVRKGKLVAGIGALTAVPLGSDVAVRIPNELLAEALMVFKRCDPEFEFTELPVELSVQGRRRLLLGSRNFRMEPYAGRALRGFVPGVPGTDELLSISSADPLASVAATSSAMLLASESLEMTKW